MANEFQAGKMILSQIGMFNEAAKLLEQDVETSVLGAIDECVEAFVKTEQWVGNFELAGDDDDSTCWLAPAQWSVGEDHNDPDAKAWFALDNIKDDTDCWTALFCNQGSAGGEAGFIFGADEGIYGKKMAWNKSFRQIDEASISALKKLGFKIVENDDGKQTFFLPIHLEAVALAETWGNDGEFSNVDPCFDPVKSALATLKTAWPIFDAILNAFPVKP